MTAEPVALLVDKWVRELVIRWESGLPVSDFARLSVHKDLHDFPDLPPGIDPAAFIEEVSRRVRNDPPDAIPLGEGPGETMYTSLVAWTAEGLRRVAIGHLVLPADDAHRGPCFGFKDANDDHAPWHGIRVSDAKKELTSPSNRAITGAWAALRRRRV